MHTENRRSFVKKSLATSVSISFTGLIRAHGEGTTDTTWSPDETTIMLTTVMQTTYPPSYWETTVASTDGNATTTWNPDETTATTVEQGLGSMQKQVPNPALSEDFSCVKTSSMQSPAGLIVILVGQVPILQLNPTWQVEVREHVTVGLCDEAGKPVQFVVEDCVTYRAVVQITMDLLGGVNMPILGAPITALLRAIFMGAANVMNPQMDPGETTFFNVEADGPVLQAGYSVTSIYGLELGMPGPMRSLVAVGNRLGRVDTSSHGYWLTVDSEVSPTPSRSVEFQWKMLLRRSKFFNAHTHIKAAILNELNAGAIQAVMAANPNAQVSVICDIPMLPVHDEIAPISQLVLAFDRPPTDSGDSCPVLDPVSFGQCSGPTPGISNEDEPDDPRWNAPDPQIPACPCSNLA